MLGKACSTQQSRQLAKTVTQWFFDSQMPEREVGWVIQEAPDFVYPVRLVAVRSRKPNGQWVIGVFICSQDDQTILRLAGFPAQCDPNAQTILYKHWLRSTTSEAAASKPVSKERKASG